MSAGLLLVDSIKDVVRSSVKVPEFDKKTPEEGRRTYRPKRCGNNNKDEDNSPKTLNDKKRTVCCIKHPRAKWLLAFKKFTFEIPLFHLNTNVSISRHIAFVLILNEINT